MLVFCYALAFWSGRRCCCTSRRATRLPYPVLLGLRPDLSTNDYDGLRHSAIWGEMLRSVGQQFSRQILLQIEKRGKSENLRLFPSQILLQMEKNRENPTI